MEVLKTFNTEEEARKYLVVRVKEAGFMPVGLTPMVEQSLSSFQNNGMFWSVVEHTLDVDKQMMVINKKEVIR
jgi:Asp-tRNA(Asn)/Glu-tRNA(Gln) amidotransferase A subunit family amidase